MIEVRRPRATLALLLAAALLAACAPPDSAPALTDLALPAAAGSLAPRLSAAPDGALLASWLEPDGAGHALRYARFADGRWSAAAVAARGDDWFVNWADTPGVFAHGGLLVAHWLRKSGASPYAYDLLVSVSADGGASWGAPRPAHGDGLAAEHGFASWYPRGPEHGGGFGLVWLDGRAAGGGDHAAHDGHGGMMQIRHAWYDAAGAQQGEDLVDESTCDCCPTDLAVGAAGPLLVYRDRTAEELRDVYATRLVDGAWTAPQVVHADGWRMPGCPVNGPAVEAVGARAAVAWFTAAGNAPQVALAWSEDGGASFGAPARIDGGRPVGRVELVLTEHEALVIWLEQGTGSSAELRLRRAWLGGRLGANHLLGSTAAARASGFPRAALAAGEVFLAWTDVGADGARQVKVGRLD